MLLAVASSSAMAEWLKVGSNEITAIYVDPTTIKKEGHLAKMWHLVDFKNVKKDMGEAYLSTKDQNEYDCKEEKMRRRAFSEHAENMGGGKMVYSDSFTTKWKPIQAESGLEVLWRFACGKKK